jgi:hypothetical protein
MLHIVIVARKHACYEARVTAISWVRHVKRVRHCESHEFLCYNCMDERLGGRKKRKTRKKSRRYARSSWTQRRWHRSLGTSSRHREAWGRLLLLLRHKNLHLHHLYRCPIHLPPPGLRLDILKKFSHFSTPFLNISEPCIYVQNCCERATLT